MDKVSVSVRACVFICVDVCVWERERVRVRIHCFFTNNMITQAGPGARERWNIYCVSYLQYLLCRQKVQSQYTRLVRCCKSFRCNFSHLLLSNLHWEWCSTIIIHSKCPTIWYTICSNFMPPIKNPFFVPDWKSNNFCYSTDTSFCTNPLSGSFTQSIMYLFFSKKGNNNNNITKKCLSYCMAFSHNSHHW